jgi:N-acetylneuraminate synthase
MPFQNFYFPQKGGRTYIIAEGGINAAGSVECATQMIKGASVAGCDAIKWQKRTPTLAVPEAQKGVIRDTPDGKMTYLEYKERTEFSVEDCRKLLKVSKEAGIAQSFSVWDLQSLDDITSNFTPDIPWLKIPSCLITDGALCTEVFEWALQNDKKVIASTGMSTLEEVDQFMRWARPVKDQLVLMHCNSSYPCKTSELNLNCIKTLKERYNLKDVGFSNHDMRVIPTIASIYKGATYIEVHYCLSREMWGTDISSSFELSGLLNLTTGIRLLEQAEGDGVKQLYESELNARKKLRHGN